MLLAWPRADTSESVVEGRDAVLMTSRRSSFVFRACDDGPLGGPPPPGPAGAGDVGDTLEDAMLAAEGGWARPACTPVPEDDE